MDRGETKQSLVSPLLLSIENLTKFETEESVEKPSNFPHVTSVEKVKKLDYSFKVKEDNFVAGDIVLWDGEKKVVASSKNFSLPISGYTPIGIVAIPASHMDDGQARMMSLRWMSCDDPENGSLTFQTMFWGTTTDISGLTNFTEVPAIARYDDDDQGGVTALTDPQEIFTGNPYGFLSSNYPGVGWTGETNPEDEGTRWHQSRTYYDENGDLAVAPFNFYAPSPYASDGTPNPLYRAVSYSGVSINNALSYFDGRQQTNAILTARGEKDYDSWKPDSGTPADYPPASCCDMYHTVGTSQGDWYLPSQAELGYVIARLNDINNSIVKIDGMQDLLSGWSWTSSVYSTNEARTVDFRIGHVDCLAVKNTHRYGVISFAKV